MTITKCKVNHLINPLGYHMDKTVFSWTVEGAAGKRQTAARSLERTAERLMSPYVSPGDLFLQGVRG